MDIMKIVTAGIIAAVLSVAIKKHVPEIAMLLAIVAAILIFMMVLPGISAVMGTLENIEKRIHSDINFLGTVFKITGIAYIAEFGSQICKDAGEGSIANKIELAGKVLILTMAAPIIMALLNLITNALS